MEYSGQKILTPEERDLITAQKELAEVVGACTVFLNANGIHFDRVLDMILDVTHESFEQTKEVIEKDRTDFKNGDIV